MLIGVPREIKNHEYRVGIAPAGVRALTDAGHEVWVETRAGERRRGGGRGRRGLPHV